MSEDKYIITHIYYLIYATSYVSQIIKSNESAIHEWEIKVNKLKYVNLYIGIDSSNNRWTNAPFMWKKDPINYSYKPNGYKYTLGHYEQYGSSYKTGDVVKMILDLKKKEIKYIVNDTSDHGVAYNNIVTNDEINYRLAICTYDKDDSVSIINYNKTMC